MLTVFWVLSLRVRAQDPSLVGHWCGSRRPGLGQRLSGDSARAPGRTISDQVGLPPRAVLLQNAGHFLHPPGTWTVPPSGGASGTPATATALLTGERMAGGGQVG